MSSQPTTASEFKLRWLSVHNCCSARNTSGALLYLVVGGWWDKSSQRRSPFPLLQQRLDDSLVGHTSHSLCKFLMPNKAFVCGMNDIHLWHRFFVSGCFLLFPCVLTFCLHLRQLAILVYIQRPTSLICLNNRWQRWPPLWAPLRPRWKRTWGFCRSSISVGLLLHEPQTTDLWPP